MFEYKVVTLNSTNNPTHAEEILNLLAAEGWKVIAATLVPTSNEICYLLQRTVPAAPAVPQS